MKAYRLKSPKLRLTEADVAKACVDVLGLRRYKVVRHNVGRFKTFDDRWITIGEPGFPDYIAVHEIYPAILLETKRPGGITSPDQERKHVELALLDLHIVTIESVEALVVWLDQHEAKMRQLWQQYTTKSCGS